MELASGYDQGLLCVIIYSPDLFVVVSMDDKFLKKPLDTLDTLAIHHPLDSPPPRGNAGLFLISYQPRDVVQP